jgi:RimJ/RimL family protein N-acetyltransferase
MVCLADGTPIGTVNTYHVEGNPDRVAVGISICESRWWGDGLGAEAFRLWVEHVLEERDLARVYCETWSGNVRMIRLAERMGFREIRRRVDVRSVWGKRWDALRFVIDREALSPPPR